MLGSIASTRSDAWFASTAAILAAVTHSNTNIQCPYRLPINKDTHDPDCEVKDCFKEADVKRLLGDAAGSCRTATERQLGSCLTDSKSRSPSMHSMHAMHGMPCMHAMHALHGMHGMHGMPCMHDMHGTHGVYGLRS